ncbi:hypothetical protein CTAM01_10988 [Colletotrichum tamarilloi]|uniref:Uncharacterized protein n=1 Tax=Colletotrichum tamarilloi TaxID=1209934 RepID=A0ABQ9QZ81_9PEZI|nr:uncharacterized protein CTAM01_10988 [Colletotrichum tamarilloi]KAK1489772.1 hypothetical protein CTAM01_10988 [Colletotrichum tamarilloi]
MPAAGKQIFLLFPIRQRVSTKHASQPISQCPRTFNQLGQLPKLLRVAPHSDRLVPDCPSLSSSVLVGSSPNLQNWRAARASFQSCKDRNRNSIGQGRLPGAEVAAVSADDRHPSVASLCSSGTLREELLTTVSLPLIDISSRLSGMSEFDFQVLGSCLGSNEVTRRTCRVGDDIGTAIISFSSNVYLTTQVSLSSRSCQILLSLRLVIAMTSAHTLSILHSFAVKKRMRNVEMPTNMKKLVARAFFSSINPFFFLSFFFFSMAPALTATTNDPSSPCISQHL